jgi:hypothetical protein
MRAVEYRPANPDHARPDFADTHLQRRRRHADEPEHDQQAGKRDPAE